MTPQFILELAIYINITLVLISFVMLIYRIYVGPSLPDRILALDLLVAFGVGLIITLSIWSGYSLYIDVAIALGLVGFLATVAFARFVLRRGGGLLSEQGDIDEDADKEEKK